MPPWRRARSLVALVAILIAAVGVDAQRSGLTGAPQLARVYDAILDARFEQVPALLTQTCGPGAQPRVAPEVCQLLDLVSLWWQIQLDPNNRSHDAQFESRADATIAAMTMWTGREPRRAEAWFYLGGAYGARAQWRVLRGERVGAARDGKRIKDALEQALALDPGLQDAWFGIGLYHYYADVAPAAAKVVRFLLFLPGGDKVAGMREMLRARNGGQLLRDEADYQLQVIDLWYEKQPERALELLRGLHERHQQNPYFLQLIAEVEDVYLHDLAASLRSWRTLLEAAQAGRVEAASMAAARARLGVALQLDRLYETDLALEPLRAVIQSRAASPYGAVAQAQWQLGQALDRLGSRDEALAAYRAAIAAAPSDDPARIVERSRAAIRTAPDPQTAAAYRTSLRAWREFERGALGDASRLVDQSLTIKPDDPVTLYRRARILAARKDVSAALATYERVIHARDTTPPTFYADACADAAQLYESTGQPARAIELYRTARTVFGADDRTKTRADRALSSTKSRAVSKIYDPQRGYSQLHSPSRCQVRP
jgi:tetratricopeptide (TPR) repeat protein